MQLNNPARFVLIAILFATMAACTSTRGAEFRLAVLSQDEKLQSMVDVLTADFSHVANVVMLERDEIAKVRTELALSAANKTDYVKMGQLVGADGLLILASNQQGTNEVLTARLLAVKPGVVLLEHAYPLPLQDMMDWSRHAVNQFEPFFPKLAVLRKNAVPISVVSLRSALQSAESRETERELAGLLIERLTREPDIFVMERQHLQEASEEKQFSAIEGDSSFWAGRYLLEGTLDEEGYDPDKLTISAKLGPAKGSEAITITLSGSRKDLPAVAEDLTQKILAGLHRASAVKDWSAKAEADKYFEEAQWVWKWGLKAEAQEACEAAWALGNHTRENAVFRLRAYKDDPALARYTSGILDSPWANDGRDMEYDIVFYEPDASCLRPLKRALELFDQNSAGILTTNSEPDFQWLDMGQTVLSQSGKVLEAYYQAAEARAGHEDELAEIRSLSRRVLSILETKDPESTNCLWVDGHPITLSALKWLQGGYWYERPEDALQMQRELFKRGCCPTYPPCVVGWSTTDRKRVPNLIKAFVEQAGQSTNQASRIDGLLLQVARAPVDESGDFQKLANELFAEVWPLRHDIFEGPLWKSERGRQNLNMFRSRSLFERIDKIIRTKYNCPNVSTRCMPEPYGSFINRLRHDVIQNLSTYQGDALGALFPQIAHIYSDTEIQEFLPILTSLKATEGGRSKLYHLNAAISAMQQSATTADSFVHARISPTPDSGTNTLIHFVPLALSDMNPGYEVSLQDMIYRHGKLWFQVRYKNGYNEVPKENPVVFVGIDTKTGNQELIPYPAVLAYPDPKGFDSLGGPRTCFEVTGDSLYVTAGGQLQRFVFAEKQWRTLNAPMEKGATFLESGGKIYLNTGDSILELEANSQRMKVLASGRRRPAENTLDQIGHFEELFPGQTADTISVVTTGSVVYSFTPSTGACEKTSLFPRNVDPDKDVRFRIPASFWTQVRFEKDGQLIDITARPKNASFLPQYRISFQCNTPDGRAQANTSYTGYWFVPWSMVKQKGNATNP